ncbi:MAG TPA: hypothetical protein VGR78_13770 [Verrucomicrobiae bacterium]|nr:hypothetical protein [Verrucomicrobiae bacterium]
MKRKKSQTNALPTKLTGRSPDILVRKQRKTPSLAGKNVRAPFPSIVGKDRLQRDPLRHCPIFALSFTSP